MDKEIKENDIAFALCTYNQQNLVIEALESIKYQIENYGVGKSFQLIIADDASSDKTVEYIENWLVEYGNIFNEITRVYGKENKGTCKNYANLLRSVHSKYLKEVAGDDLLPVDNIIPLIEMTSIYDLIFTPQMKFCDGKFYSGKLLDADSVTHSLFSCWDIKHLIFGYNPISNGTLWNLRFNTVDAVEYMEKGDIIEDQRFWLAAIKTGGTFTFTYVNTPTFLHRVTNRSVSASDSIYKERSMRDIMSFRSQSLKYATTALDKLDLYMLKSGLGKYSIMNILFKLKRIVHKKKIDRNRDELANRYVLKNEAHIDNMRRNAEKFIKNIVGEED